MSYAQTGVDQTTGPGPSSGPVQGKLFGVYSNARPELMFGQYDSFMEAHAFALSLARRVSIVDHRGHTLVLEVGK